MTDAVLEVRDLVIAFDTDAGLITAVDGVSFSVGQGRTLGIVGESGCGKSVTALSLIQLLPRPMGRILGGEVWFKGQDLLKLDESAIRQVLRNAVWQAYS